MSEPNETAQCLTGPGVPPGRHSALHASVRILLAHILAQIDFYRDAPLSFELDYEGIAAEAWKSFSAEWLATHSDGVPSWEDALPVLDQVTEQLLSDHEPGVSPASETERSGRRGESPGRWVARLQLAVRNADTNGPKIVQLLAEGFPCRDVARRLELGLQMTRRIVDDIRTVWRGRNPEPDESC